MEKSLNNTREKKKKENQNHRLIIKNFENWKLRPLFGFVFFNTFFFLNVLANALYHFF